MYSQRSSLLAPSTVGTSCYKFISGISHGQEWERQVSFIGMAFGQEILNAQIFSDALSYATKPISTETAPNLAPTAGFSSYQSPATGSHGAPPGSRTDIALHAHDRIPMYDARNTVFDCQTDWPVLSKVLPPFMTEVPRGSFIAVGYTCNTYFGSEKWQLSCNVQFVVVLGTPY
ncbi:hypothetical protein GALMADRAFT_67610 [Galerina marginata CBS 339.88]|uniref:Uncharacterized protein n=1 Tax=Galerina marginata (strain CBS 339.88) TaxID=685588 RepID=A0A067T1F8_GALM3|nr:hypothetical protein GALMADRAFT_67610 [Galerina marginata CBS 339.88]